MVRRTWAPSLVWFCTFQRKMSPTLMWTRSRSRGQQLGLRALAAALHAHDHVLAHEPPWHAGRRRRVTISAHGRGRDRRRGRAGRPGRRPRADRRGQAGRARRPGERAPTSAARRTGRSAGCSSSTRPSSAGCGVHDSVELAWQRLAGQRPVRPARRRGRVGGAVGPRVRRVRGGREARPGWPGSGSRWLPTVGWAERGDLRADGHGNSVPRFHVTWGTGTGVVEPFVAAAEQAAEARAGHLPPPAPGRRAARRAAARSPASAARVLAPDDAPRGVAVQPGPWSASSS